MSVSGSSASELLARIQQGNNQLQNNADFASRMPPKHSGPMHPREFLDVYPEGSFMAHFMKQLPEPTPKLALNFNTLASPAQENDPLPSLKSPGMFS